MWAVFSSIMDFRSAGIENFALYLITGQLTWAFFAESTNTSMSSVIVNAPLLRKVYIPKYIFPLEKTCFGLVNFLMSFIALFFIMLITGAQVYPSIFLAIYPIITLFIFNLGVSLVLSTMAVFFRDIMHLWTVFSTALMYFSAIFYDPYTMSGSDGFAILQTFIGFNPMYWYITTFRSTIFGTGLTPNMIFVCGGCSIVALFFGLIVFKRNQDKFVLYI